MLNQNSALNFLYYLQSLVADNQLTIDTEVNPRVLYVGNDGSLDFLYGRDDNNEPYIGIPSGMMPWFVHVDWMGVAICRKKGYLFLEAKDSTSQMLHMALGLKVRKERLDYICLKGVEVPEELRLSFRVFQIDPDSPKQAIFSDKKVMSNLYIREIEDVSELGTELEAEDAMGLFEKSGLDSGFTSIKLG